VEVRYEGVNKLFGQVAALRELTLTVQDGAFLALLGPSGCGKTTALRILAGLERPSAGQVFIGERQVTFLEPRDRDVAMVFQSYALYPHMSVRQNIAYPLRIRGVAAAQIEQQVREVASLLRIEQLLERRPRQLSGGQRQRVALARAIIRRPAAFLMDEPLSNLDAQLRLHMRGELKHLQKTLGTTTIYVTHDQAEALTMADWVAVMDQGLLQQLAPPREVYDRPANRFVATFVGSPPMNLLPGTMDGAGSAFRGERFSLPLPTAVARALADQAQDRKVELGVRPEDVLLRPQNSPDATPADVYAVEPMGNETLVELRLDGVPIIARADADFQSQIGDSCWIGVNPARVHLFDVQTGTRVAGASASLGLGMTA
jgi:multiple sugar transport system ATP-binding protein